MNKEIQIGDTLKYNNNKKETFYQKVRENVKR